MHAAAASEPRVSVLLPGFNAAATLPACLRSLQRQTEERWHCVLVDDGSTDDTLAIARQAARGDRRIEVIARPHEGLVRTLMAGLPHCRAGYVARMDADDLMHRQRLAAQCAALDAAPELAAVGCHVRSFPRRTLTHGWRTYERWLNGMTSAAQVRRDALIECPVAHPTWMIRTEILRERGYRDCGWPEDYDLLLRLLGGGCEIGVVPRRLLSWRDHPQRITRRAAQTSLAAITACRAAFLAGGLLARHSTYILWGYGGTGRALRRALLKHGKHPAFIVEVHPGRLGNRIHGAPVVAPEDLQGLPRRPLIASVAGETARCRIRALLDASRWQEGRDYVCAA